MTPKESPSSRSKKAGRKHKPRPSSGKKKGRSRDVEETPGIDAGAAVVTTTQVSTTEVTGPAEPVSPPEKKKQSCPVCEWLLEGTESKCPKCGTVLWVGERDRQPTPPPASEGEPVESQAEVASRLRACPVCGTVSSAGFSRCPWCNTSFEEAATEESGAEAPPEAPAPEEVVSQPAEPELKGAKQVRKRKLKTAKATAIPATAPKSAVGRTNGLGHVNGLGRSREEGSPRGESFVNGTGISEGQGKRASESSRKRAKFLMRWQFLAVLVVALVILSTFIFLSYSNGGDKYSIDGDFSDWSGATVYGVDVASTSQTTNITEWAVANQGSKLFLYFETQGNAMGSANPESFYLFVDSDGSNKTGYVVESIGADYMLQLTGWDSAAKSTSLASYPASSDQYNWNAWSSAGALSVSLSGARVEAGATLPQQLGENARFVLVSKDYANRGSVSHTAPLMGGLLIIHQTPVATVSETGVVQKASSVAMLTLRFTSDGEGGEVSQIVPSVTGAQLASQPQGFSLAKGQSHEITISVDTSAAVNGHLVSVEVLASDITSTFASVEVVGSGARAYTSSPPTAIAIDGAFADWAGRLSIDTDQQPVTDSSLDVDEVGNSSTAADSFFYVSVTGEICSGEFVPAAVVKPSGSGGGGTVVPTRRTAEDTLTIYVDSDRSNSTGMTVTLGLKKIGADQKIEVKGLYGEITSAREFNYWQSSGTWIDSPGVVSAAKDEKRIEIGVSSYSLGGSADVDFIVETTSWKERGDLAAFDPSSLGLLTRTWIVDPGVTSPYATSMSYQRKLFYDGTNYWSFYFDGANTVCKYSTDNGQTWSYSDQVFLTSGINETSIWFDSSTRTVYAVGDSSLASVKVAVQAGSVDPLAHKITWAASDYGLNVSSFPLAGKNTYITKDANGYLWVLSSNSTGIGPGGYQLSAFVSIKTNSTTAWRFSGQMLAASSALDKVKGSIVPAGSGSDVWAVYAYSGNVAARKFTGTWQLQQMVYPQQGSKTNTDNSPPSVVVDGKGVVHVVYGTGRKLGTASVPEIEYSYNVTGSTTFTPGVVLDPIAVTSVGDYFPTISLDSTTGDLHALWLRSDSAQVPRTVVYKKCVSGSWSDVTIAQQTTFPKYFLTSAYSVPEELAVSWQWTQNVTATEVLFDNNQIPEFNGLALPIVAFLALFVFYGRRRGKIQSGNSLDG